MLQLKVLIESRPKCWPGILWLLEVTVCNKNLNFYWTLCEWMYFINNFHLFFRTSTDNHIVALTVHTQIEQFVMVFLIVNYKIWQLNYLHHETVVSKWNLKTLPYLSIMYLAYNIWIKHLYKLLEIVMISNFFLYNEKWKWKVKNYLLST